MTIGRVSQSMLARRSLENLQVGMERASRLQEQLSSGRSINRPSDSPSGTSAAMKLRSTTAEVQQYQRAAQDGASWLDTADAALSTATDTVRTARQLGIQGQNSALGQASRDALAASVDQLRQKLVGVANTTYLDRPVFGGIAPGSAAYDETGTFVGEPGEVLRTVGDGQRVRVDVDGPEAFGDGDDSVFARLESLSTALRAGDTEAVGQALTALSGDLDRIGRVQADAGARAARIDQAGQVAEATEIRLKGDLSEIEDVDFASTVVQLKLQEVAYQAALGATARVLQPSLMEFLR